MTNDEMNAEIKHPRNGFLAVQFGEDAILDFGISRSLRLRHSSFVLRHLQRHHRLDTALSN